MGLVHGRYGAKSAGLRPGGARLRNCMSGHGRDCFECWTGLGKHVDPAQP